MSDFNTFLGETLLNLPDIEKTAMEHYRNIGQDERAVKAASEVTLRLLRDYHAWMQNQ